MIIHLKAGIPPEKAKELARNFQAIHLIRGEQQILLTPSAQKTLPEPLEALTETYYAMDSDIQLASRSYQEKRSIPIGSHRIGSTSDTTLMIAGPCSVESWEQISATAEMLLALGISTLRAGCFKPRTSPYSFQGLGEEGLKLLTRVRAQYGLNIITEIKDSSHADLVIEHTDIIQVGAKAMYDHGILKKCGRACKPVLLKRGFGTTLQEFVQSAEFILSGGNEQVMLCERGIRTFETKTRFTLDLTGVAYLKEFTNLPIVVDPSHAMGYRYGVPDLTRAALAMGIDGLLIETHPTPHTAWSDAAQQLSFDQFRNMYETLKPIASAIGKQLI